MTIPKVVPCPGVRSSVVRRHLVLVGFGAKAAVGAESDPDNLPPNVSEWTPYLGDGVM